MNWTRPGRCHVIVNRRVIWLTLWMFGRRLHVYRGIYRSAVSVFALALTPLPAHAMDSYGRITDWMLVVVSGDSNTTTITPNLSLQDCYYLMNRFKPRGGGRPVECPAGVLRMHPDDTPLVAARITSVHCEEIPTVSSPEVFP